MQNSNPPRKERTIYPQNEYALYIDGKKQFYSSNKSMVERYLSRNWDSLKSSDVKIISTQDGVRKDVTSYTKNGNEIIANVSNGNTYAFAADAFYTPKYRDVSGTQERYYLTQGTVPVASAGSVAELQALISEHWSELKDFSVGITDSNGKQIYGFEHRKDAVTGAGREGAGIILIKDLKTQQSYEMDYLAPDASKFHPEHQYMLYVNGERVAYAPHISSLERVVSENWDKYKDSVVSVVCSEEGTLRIASHTSYTQSGNEIIANNSYGEQYAFAAHIGRDKNFFDPMFHRDIQGEQLRDRLVVNGKTIATGNGSLLQVTVANNWHIYKNHNVEIADAKGNTLYRFEQGEPAIPGGGREGAGKVIVHDLKHDSRSNLWYMAPAEQTRQKAHDAPSPSKDGGARHSSNFSNRQTPARSQEKYYLTATDSAGINRLVTMTNSLKEAEIYLAQNWDAVNRIGKPEIHYDRDDQYIKHASYEAYSRGAILATRSNGNTYTFPIQYRAEICHDEKEFNFGRTDAKEKYYLRIGGEQPNGLDNIIASGYGMMSMQARISDMWTQIRENGPIEVIDDNGKVVCFCEQGEFGDVQTGQRGEISVVYPDGHDFAKIYYTEQETPDGTDEQASVSGDAFVHNTQRDNDSAR